MSRQEREVKVKLQEDEISDLINSITSRAQYKGSIQQRDEYYDTDNLYITNLNRGLRIRFQEGSPYTL